MYHDRVYLIDTQSCTQGIITFCELADFEPKYLDMVGKIARWTISKMQDKEGYFYYRIYKNGKTDKTAYIRWDKHGC